MILGIIRSLNNLTPIISEMDFSKMNAAAMRQIDLSTLTEEELERLAFCSWSVLTRSLKKNRYNPMWRVKTPDDPEEYEKLLDMIRRDGFVLQEFLHQNEEMCIIAASQNSGILRWVKNPTSAIYTAAFFGPTQDFYEIVD